MYLQISDVVDSLHLLTHYALGAASGYWIGLYRTEEINREDDWCFVDREMTPVLALPHQGVGETFFV